MNTVTLGKLYDTLEPLERVALIVAAGARSDEVEQGRLADAAPRVRCELPHHYVVSQTLLRLALTQDALRLGLALKAVLTLQWVEATSEPEGEDAEADQAEACLAAAEAALTYRAYREGWRLFCREVRVDPAVFDELQIEGDAIAMAERLIDSEFPDDWQEEADDEDGSDGECSLPTPDNVALEWRARFLGAC